MSDITSLCMQRLLVEWNNDYLTLFGVWVTTHCITLLRHNQCVEPMKYNDVYIFMFKWKFASDNLMNFYRGEFPLNRRVVPCEVVFCHHELWPSLLVGWFLSSSFSGTGSDGFTKCNIALMSYCQYCGIVKRRPVYEGFFFLNKVALYNPCVCLIFGS